MQSLIAPESMYLHPPLSTMQAADADKLLSSLPTATTQPDGSTDGASAAPPALYPALLRMQLALEGRDAKRALAVLQSLDKGLQMRPGMLATRVALHEQVCEYKNCMGAQCVGCMLMSCRLATCTSHCAH